MLTSIAEINKASRDGLEDYLEIWGYFVSYAESTDELREAAVENFKTEGY